MKRLPALLSLVALILLGLLLPARPTSAAPATLAISITSFMYMPSAPSVHVGDTIAWANHDSAPHTVTSISGPTKLDSPQFTKGHGWSFTATKPGTYQYYCAVHPDMKASFRVLPTAATPPTAVTPSTTAPQPAAVRASKRAITPSKASPAHPADAATQVPAPLAPVVQPPIVAATSGSSTKALDPDLLLAALTAGAVVASVLALGRRGADSKG